MMVGNAPLRDVKVRMVIMAEILILKVEFKVVSAFYVDLLW